MVWYCRRVSRLGVLSFHTPVATGQRLRAAISVCSLPHLRMSCARLKLSSGIIALLVQRVEKSVRAEW